MRAESGCHDALSNFCGALKELRQATGPTIESLARNPKVPLARAQLMATLNGHVVRPPKWTFVAAFVEECVASARRSKLEIAEEIDLRKWLDDHKKLTELCARRGEEEAPVAARGGRQTGRVLTVQKISECAVAPPPAAGPVRRLGVVTGDIRQVRCAQIWVNSENTEMEMARVHEFSVSAIIRYEGARRDGQGRVTEDLIADELRDRVRDHRPLEPGSVVRTGAGELWRNGVRHIVHAATVHGEPGSGWHPMKELGRCVTNTLNLVEEFDGDAFTILFPLLGAGNAGGELNRIAALLIHAACNYLRAAETTRVGRVLFLAHTDLEYKACEAAFRKAGLKLPDGRAVRS